MTEAERGEGPQGIGAGREQRHSLVGDRGRQCTGSRGDDRGEYRSEYMLLSSSSSTNERRRTKEVRAAAAGTGEGAAAKVV